MGYKKIKLKIEYNSQCVDRTIVEQTPFGHGVISPVVSDDYWLFRVPLFENQALLAFPKCFTMGIGFAQEEVEQNVNLPYECGIETILKYLKRNKKYEDISDAKIREAIKMLKALCKRFLQENPKYFDRE